MASWGNQTGSQYTQDMDSNGKKLKVTGETPNASTFQAEFEDTNARGNAVNVKGNIRIEKNAEQFGIIKPDTSLQNNPRLVIDASDKILYLNGDQLWLGTTSDSGWAVAIKGPVLIAGSAYPIDLQVTGAIKATEKVYAQEYDGVSAGNNVTFGGMNANRVVNIGSSAQQIILGTGSGDTAIILRSNAALLAGNLQVDGTINVDGAAVDGDLIVGHAGNPVNIDFTGSLFTVRAPTIIEDGAQINRSTTIGTPTQAANLTVRGNIQSEGDLARSGSFYATATEVIADQPTTIRHALSVHDVSTFLDDVRMDGNSINMESSGSKAVSMIAQNDRLEFYIEGKLRYYIDNTGGHNA